LFLTQEYNKEGIYRIRICKNGEWVTVTVDDYIPCYYNAGPMFAHSKGDELWVLLLEKAYAKIHGNYYALKSGFSFHGMIDMTGCPTEHVKMPLDRTNWEDVEEDANELFEKMLEADEQGYLISASTPGKDNLTTGDGTARVLESGGRVLNDLFAGRSHARRIGKRQVMLVDKLLGR
jgi:calpain-15